MTLWLKPFFIATLLYYFLGQLGLLLAIPPGFASAVWPAAGGALFCLIYFRHWSVLIGVGIGSFLVNVAVSSSALSQLSWSSIMPAITIASGAMLQAYMGYFLYSRFVGFRDFPDDHREIIRFLLIVAPIGCLCAPIIGVGSLYFFDFISSDNIAFSGLTWWVGDTIGVLLFVPFFLTLMMPLKQTSLTRKLEITIPIILLFSSVLVLFFKSLSARQNEISQDVNQNGQRFISNISKQLDDAKYTMRAYAAYFSGSEFVSRVEFEQFSQLMFAENNVFQGIGWTEIIREDDREQVELAIQQQGFGNFHFTEIDADGALITAPTRADYYPVLYIFPLKHNARAFGLNLGANKDRFHALVQARKQLKPVATRPILLVQEHENQQALILYHPIFSDTLRLRSQHAPSSDDNFKGYISGVIRFSDLVNNIADVTKSRDFGFSIVDNTQTDDVIELFTRHTSANAAFTLNESIDFGGRNLQLSFYATNEYQISTKNWNSWTIIAVGLLLVAIFQGFIMIITGQTELISQEVKRKTKALRKAMRVTEQANRAKSDFTATISHEIRTPLNAIIGLINQTLKTTLSAQQQYYLQQARLSSSSLLSLINLTLDFSKIEAGKLEIETVKFSMIEVLQKLQAIFERLAKNKGIDFNVIVSQPLPNVLLGDPLRLEQILINLLGNAIKFTEQGEVKFLIELEQFKDNALKFTFIVEDTGIGIAKGQQQKLFDSFQQADSSMSRKFGGTGLGLTISKQLVELMNGTISFTSVEHQGSEFCLTVVLELDQSSGWLDSDTIMLSLTEPKAIEQSNVCELGDTQLTEPDIISVAQGITEGSLANINILLVEDVEINQLIVTEILQEHGATVTTANNGRQALEKIQQSCFDLVLMDIQMPEMDGYQATQAIRKIPQFTDLLIIAMTANAMSSDIEQAIAVGMNGHIAKPIDEQDMLTKITTLITKKP